MFTIQDWGAPRPLSIGRDHQPHHSNTKIVIVTRYHCLGSTAGQPCGITHKTPTLSLLISPLLTVLNSSFYHVVALFCVNSWKAASKKVCCCGVIVQPPRKKNGWWHCTAPGSTWTRGPQCSLGNEEKMFPCSQCGHRLWNKFKFYSLYLTNP